MVVVITRRKGRRINKGEGFANVFVCCGVGVLRNETTRRMVLLF